MPVTVKIAFDAFMEGLGGFVVYPFACPPQDRNRAPRRSKGIARHFEKTGRFISAECEKHREANKI